MDIETARIKPDWRTWMKYNSKESASHEFSEWVPRNILFFAAFVEELFNTKTLEEAVDMIEKAKPFLKDLEGARMRGGPADNLYNNLFETQETEKPEDIDLEDTEDERIRSLEESMRNE
jgi:hypothetical protein